MSEAAEQLARRIAQDNGTAMLECLFGGTTSDTVKRIVHDGLKASALAAINETTQAAAILLESECEETVLGMHLVKLIRSDEHLSREW